MGNDSKKNIKKNQDISANAFYDVLFMIIIPLLFASLYFSIKAYDMAKNPVNVGSLKHYDSFYTRETGNISMNPNGDITGYTTPDGLYYIFKEPIPADLF